LIGVRIGLLLTALVTSLLAGCYFGVKHGHRGDSCGRGRPPFDAEVDCEAGLACTHENFGFCAVACERDDACPSLGDTDPPSVCCLQPGRRGVCVDAATCASWIGADGGGDGSS
jgi:hypothetical protein